MMNYMVELEGDSMVTMETRESMEVLCSAVKFWLILLFIKSSRSAEGQSQKFISVIDITL